MTAHALRADVLRPSALGATERARWQEIQARCPSLQRAFLTPTFAEACERANGRAYVAVLHQGGAIRGFLPFQFHSAWHQGLRLAERIGGEMSDAAGLIADPDLRIDAASLLRLAGLASLSMTHLMAGQEQYGLDAAWSDDAYLTDLRSGHDAYYATMLHRERAFVRETERKMRRAQSLYGELIFTRMESISTDMIARLIEQKRRQYQRTQVADALAGKASVRLIAALAERPAVDCHLVMSSLEAGGSLLAQHLGPQYHDVLSIWFPVYDTEAHSVSPGRLLMWRMLQRAGEDGINLVDYGAGAAVYKKRFSTTVTRCGRAAWFSRDLRSAVARAFLGVEWRLRAGNRKLRMRMNTGTS